MPPLPRRLPGYDCSLTKGWGTDCHPKPTHPGTTTGPGFAHGYVLILHLVAGPLSLCPSTKLVDRVRRAAGWWEGRDRVPAQCRHLSSSAILLSPPQVRPQAPRGPRQSRELSGLGKGSLLPLQPSPALTCSERAQCGGNKTGCRESPEGQWALPFSLTRRPLCSPPLEWGPQELVLPGTR